MWHIDDAALHATSLICNNRTIMAAAKGKMVTALDSRKYKLIWVTSFSPKQTANLWQWNDEQKPWCDWKQNQSCCFFTAVFSNLRALLCMIPLALPCRWNQMNMQGQWLEKLQRGKLLAVSFSKQNIFSTGWLGVNHLDVSLIIACVKGDFHIYSTQSQISNLYCKSVY